jgi:hypothetical protein
LTKKKIIRIAMNCRNSTNHRDIASLLCTRIVLIVAALCSATLSFAQVGTPGSREERQSDARSLSAKSSEKPATPADKALLEAQLQALIDAYERGDVGFFQAKIDPGMPGYSRVLDAMRRDATSQTRPRLLFTDQTWTVGENIAMLQGIFQKRYFDARNLNPELISGRVVMLLSREGDLWRISAITGDNPFESRAVAPCNTGIVRLTSPANANAEPFFFEIDDADLAGVPSIQADIVTDRGDRETVTLNALNPNGLFRAQINARRLSAQGVATPGNNLIDLIGDALITARYNDQCVAGTRAQQITTANDTRRDPGTLGQLACRIGGNTTFVSLATASVNGAVAAPITIELNDPDLAGLPSIDVLLRTTAGDVETVTLGAIGGLGRFLSNSVQARAATGITIAPRNGVLELGAAGGLSVEYVDQRSGVVGRTQTIIGDCGAISSGYQAAQLACTINATTNDIAVGQTTNLPIQISVTDPDLALTNPAFVNVTLRNAGGDSEVVRLNPSGTGRYSASSIPARQGSAGANNGVFEFSATGAINAEYSDSTVPGGTAPGIISATCGSFRQGAAPATLATLEFSATGIDGRTPYAFSTGNSAIQGNCSVTVRDPDLSGQSSVTVSLRAVQASSGKVDTETLTLPATSPGVFQRSTCAYEGFVASNNNTAATFFNPVPNNNIINLGGGATQMTVSFTDNTVPGGGSQVITRTITVNN